MKINTRHRAVRTSAALVTAGALFAATGCHPGYVPRNGHLCQAVENIQFYAFDMVTPSYVVHANEYIRIDNDGDFGGVHWTKGHGDGHSTRVFIYSHADGRLRLRDCHF